MTTGIRIKLSTMMFLEFFIWGAWFVTMGTYLTTTLHATGTQNAGAYATQSLGAIIAPFVIGLIADKFFSAQRILGVLHLVGAGLLYYESTAKKTLNFSFILQKLYSNKRDYMTMFLSENSKMI